MYGDKRKDLRVFWKQMKVMMIQGRAGREHLMEVTGRSSWGELQVSASGHIGLN